MEDLFNSVYSTHKGISFSTVVVFGAFIFLLFIVFIIRKKLNFLKNSDLCPSNLLIDRNNKKLKARNFNGRTGID